MCQRQQRNTLQHLCVAACMPEAYRAVARHDRWGRMDDKTVRRVEG